MKPDSRGTNPWWITGLVESDGSFSAERQGRHFVVSFTLRARPANLPLLEAVFAFFRVGRIYETKTGALLKVTQTEELEELVDHFDRYPLIGPKAEVFGIWREMVLVKKGTFRTPPTETLSLLADRLASVRQTSTRTSTPEGPRVTSRSR